MRSQFGVWAPGRRVSILGMISSLGGHVTRAGIVVLCASLAAGLVPQGAHAAPITYTGFTITDGKLGSWEFHSARVYLTLESDTSSAHTIRPFPGTDVDVSINSSGNAYITIVTAQKTVRAEFEPGQIFVGVDRGRELFPLRRGGRGVGFGSFTSGGGVEVAYPLGIEDGTIDSGDISNPSAALSTLSLDLTQPTAFSGRGWSCLGFTDDRCPMPTQPLKTNQGDLFLYQPYQQVPPAGPCELCADALVGAVFTAELGRSSHNLFRGGERSDSADSHRTRPITYTGALVSDVRVGRRHFRHALIYITFDADISTAHPYEDGSSIGTVNAVGRARFRIVSGTESLEGQFAPGELYVFFDRANVSVGFGSKHGGRGYPFAITASLDFDGLVENSVMTAVRDFFNTPADSALYTPATSDLVSWSGPTPGTGTASYELATPTVLSGGVSSCVAFDPATSYCANLQPVALKTSAGDFRLSEPYTEDPAGDGSQTYSINWGLFWAEVPAERDE